MPVDKEAQTRRRWPLALVSGFGQAFQTLHYSRLINFACDPLFHRRNALLHENRDRNFWAANSWLCMCARARAHGERFHRDSSQVCRHVFGEYLGNSEFSLQFWRSRKLPRLLETELDRILCWKGTEVSGRSNSFEKRRNGYIGK